MPYTYQSIKSAQQFNYSYILRIINIPLLYTTLGFLIIGKLIFHINFFRNVVFFISQSLTRFLIFKGRYCVIVYAGRFWYPNFCPTSVKSLLYYKDENAYQLLRGLASPSPL